MSNPLPSYFRNSTFNPSNIGFKSSGHGSEPLTTADNRYSQPESIPRSESVNRLTNGLNKAQTSAVSQGTGYTMTIFTGTPPVWC